MVRLRRSPRLKLPNKRLIVSLCFEVLLGHVLSIIPFVWICQGINSLYKKNPLILTQASLVDFYVTRAKLNWENEVQRVEAWSARQNLVKSKLA